MPVKYIGYDLLNRYGMIHKFKVPSATLETFLSRIEEGEFSFTLSCCFVSDVGGGGDGEDHKMKVHVKLTDLVLRWKHKQPGLEV